MGYFNYVGSGQGGNLGTGATAPTNFSRGTFNITDGNGKVIRSIEIDNNNQAKYTKSITAADIGQKTIKARYTGDHIYAAGPLDTFSAVISDGQGLNSSDAQIGTVNQIVAGPGIWISAPNGQGVVTVSTEPLNINPFKGDLIDVSWSYIVYDYDANYKPIYENVPYGAVGQFTAVGDGGVVLRSRDGKNWVQMYPWTTATLYGAASQLAAIIDDGKVEYMAVGSSGQGAYGRLWSGTDSLKNVGQLYDQDGAIIDDLFNVGVFINSAVVVNNQQFQGGLTQAAIDSEYGATVERGVPLVVTALKQIVSYFKIPKINLRKSNGVASLVFSDSSDDQVWLDINLTNEDIRITPGTSISGQYPIYVFDSIGQIYAVTFPVNVTPPESVYYFTPFVQIYIGNELIVQDYWPTANWNASNFSTTKLSLNIGTAGQGMLTGLGQYEIRVDIKSNHNHNWVDYSFTSRFTVGA